MTMSNLKLGVVGAGFVGGSVINGFDTDTVDLTVVDPLVSNVTIKELVKSQPHLIFVCVPTPQGEDGSVDVSVADTVLSDIEHHKFKGIVVIKSTITPDHLIRFKKQHMLSLVYNPEFLTEANAHADFIDPNMQVLGGKWRDCDKVEKAYVRHSKVKTVPTYKVDLITASMIKYTINSWLATKVIWFNQLKHLYDASGASASWETFTEILKTDPRMGNTHMQVPGPDGKFGFGGHCFPKDVAAFLEYAEKNNAPQKLLDKANTYNKRYRL
jgi:UDPglucose 6-dehydrogenase